MGAKKTTIRDIAKAYAERDGDEALEHAVVITFFGCPIEKVYHWFGTCEGAQERYDHAWPRKRGILWRSRLEHRHPRSTPWKATLLTV